MTKKEEVDGERPVWPISTDVMRERFKQRAENAGYPRNLFSFHSLRSGFICSALIKSGKNEDSKKAVLEKTALIAGWVPYRLAQMTYIKNVARRAIVSSRLVMPYKEGRNESEMDETLLELEMFHGIVLKMKEGNEKNPYEKYKEKVEERMKIFFEEEEVKKAKKARYIRSGSVGMCAENMELNDFIKQKMAMTEYKGKKKQTPTLRTNCAVFCWRNYIKQQLFMHIADPYITAEEFCNHAEINTSTNIVRKYEKKKLKDNKEKEKSNMNEENDKDNEKELSDKNEIDQKKLTFDKRKRNEKNNVCRIKWTKEDDEKVKRMYEVEKKTITEINKEFIFRSWHNIHDHIKHMIKKGKLKKRQPQTLKEILHIDENIATNLYSSSTSYASDTTPSPSSSASASASDTTPSSSSSTSASASDTTPSSSSSTSASASDTTPSSSSASASAPSLLSTYVNEIKALKRKRVNKRKRKEDDEYVDYYAENICIILKGNGKRITRSMDS